jgi:hypothetical protein
MNRFARALAVTFGIVVLGSFVLLVPQKNATAQSGPAVTIASPLPLPVKGSVSATVSGTVAAQQSGNWNVGLSGTPTVQLANTTTPLLVKSVDEAYANRGGLPVAGGSDHLASGFVADALPNPAVLSGTGSVTIDFLVLRGYIVP